MKYPKVDIILQNARVRGYETENFYERNNSSEVVDLSRGIRFN